MSNSKKRKYDEQLNIPTDFRCIIHNSGLSNHGDCVTLNSTKLKVSAEQKLDQLHSIRNKRLAEPCDSPHRMHDICKSIPASLCGIDLNITGYHRGCYQAFTKNLDRLSKAECTKHSQKHHSPRIFANCSNQFPPECIFCKKLEVKPKKHANTERCVQFTNTTWQQIESQAFEVGDFALYRLVQGEDLVAREAMFHTSCRKDFELKVFNLSKRQSMGGSVKNSHTSENLAQQSVRDMISQKVVVQKEVIPLASVRDLYITEMHNNGFPNINYNNRTLKVWLQSDPIGQKIAFTKQKGAGCIMHSVVFSADMTVPEAIASGFKLGLSSVKEEVATYLRKSVKQAYTVSKPLPWPPTADDLDAFPPEELVPDALQTFLTQLVCGDSAGTEKTRRIVLSIAQDICRAVTNGEWKMPKHILLSTTVRHLYRSKILTTMLSRLGHSESYDYSLELETSLAKALNDSSSKLTPLIVTGPGNEVFHVEWDNLNKITTNIHGSNVVNSTAGIMIQELKPGYCATSSERTLGVYQRTKARSLKVDEQECLPPTALTKRCGPTFPREAVFTTPHENHDMYLKALLEYRIWFLSRVVGSSADEQSVPGFGGFISSTGLQPSRKSTIDYFTPIDQPFTDYAVIEALLEQSEQATKEVGQKYVLSTFDLGGCMKALPLIWKYPERYKYHVITPGAFHTAMNYIGMVTKNKCAGSGYGEILIEAGLVTSGCIQNVLSGKAYAKALFCLKTVTEAMERLLFERFAENMESELNPTLLMKLVTISSRDTLNSLLDDQSVTDFIDQYISFEDSVRHGELGKTAMFWLSVVDHARLVLMLLYAVKTNNLDLFHQCYGQMAELFFAYDGPNYSRYLTWFEVFLTNIDLTHPGAKELLQKGGIAVTRSLIPGSCSAVDKTMEETFMKFAKSAGGFTGLFSMFGAYQRWCRTTSTRVRFYEKMLDMCGMVEDADAPKAGRHRELERAEIRKSEEAVVSTMTAICNFSNPFKATNKEHLYSLASGAPVPPDAEQDVLRAEVVGKEAKQRFIAERLTHGASPIKFFDPIPKSKLKSMEASNKTVKLTAPQGKVIQYQEQSNIAFMLLVKAQSLNEQLDLEELMRFPLTPVPHSLGTPDGFFCKSNKAALMNAILQDVPQATTPSESTIYIQDGNALFHELTNLAPTFGGICLQILDIMVARKNFIFSTDSYFPNSIKAQERVRRGCSRKFIVDGPATRRPADFKEFLSNDDNKTQLCNLILRVWGSESAASRLDRCGTAVVVVGGRAYQLKKTNGDVRTEEIFSLVSNQEETDTRVVLYMHYASTIGYQSAIVRTPDSDLFFITLFHAQSVPLTVYLDVGTGKQRKVVNISELADSQGAEYSETLLGLHVFTGEDVTSAFKGKGKVTPLRKLQSNPKYHKTFRMLGDTWTVEEDVMQMLEAFVCVMYGCPRERSVNTCRAVLLKKMVGDDEQLTMKSKVELSKLPPCQDNLCQHIRRVNHRLGILKNAHTPVIEHPEPHDEGQGWTKKNEVLEPLWAEGPILPPTLVDLVENVQAEMEEEDDDGCLEISVSDDDE